MKALISLILLTLTMSAQAEIESNWIVFPTKLETKFTGNEIEWYWFDTKNCCSNYYEDKKESLIKYVRCNGYDVNENNLEKYSSGKHHFADRFTPGQNIPYSAVSTSFDLSITPTQTLSPAVSLGVGAGLYGIVLTFEPTSTSMDLNPCMESEALAPDITWKDITIFYTTFGIGNIIKKMKRDHRRFEPLTGKYSK